MGSMAPNGSSINSTGGSAANARATPARWRWPPDSSVGYRLANWAGGSPTRSSNSVTRAATRSRDHPSRRGTVATLSATVRWGNNPTCWITYPMWRRSSTADWLLMSVPLTVMVPEVGSIRRLIIFMVVVLPHPDGPTRTHSSPSPMSIDRLFTATSPP